MWLVMRTRPVLPLKKSCIVLEAHGNSRIYDIWYLLIVLTAILANLTTQFPYSNNMKC